MGYATTSVLASPGQEHQETGDADTNNVSRQPYLRCIDFSEYAQKLEGAIVGSLSLVLHTFSDMFARSCE
jgi:hypothetical protein